MGAMTDYLADALRDHVLRNTTYTSPATVYAALFSTATTEVGTGTEVTGGSYARQAVTFSAGTPAGQAIAGGISFSSMPTVTVVALAIYDAASGGNMLFHGRLPSARAVVSGETYVLNSSDLRILID